MPGNIPNEYLITQVMTATPQKLHLMLIEAALRQCERTRRLWRESQDDVAGESLAKAQEILTELLASLDYATHPDLVRRIASVYLFVFRSLVTAQVRRNESSLADAVRLLEIERETWRQIVQKDSASTSSAPHTAHAPHPVPAPTRWIDVPSSSISFEA